MGTSIPSTGELQKQEKEQLKHHLKDDTTRGANYEHGWTRWKRTPWEPHRSIAAPQNQRTRGGEKGNTAFGVEY